MDRFTEYISIPEFAQGVLFGTKPLKLNSEEKIIIRTSGQKERHLSDNI